MITRGSGLLELALAETGPVSGFRASFDQRRPVEVFRDCFAREQGRWFFIDNFVGDPAVSSTDGSQLGNPGYTGISRTGAAGTATFTRTAHALSLSGTTPVLTRDFEMVPVNPSIEMRLTNVLTAFRHMYIIKWIDANNYAAWIPGALQFRVVVGGTVTNTTTQHGTLTPAIGDIWKVTLETATNTVRCYRNGTQHHTQTLTELPTATKIGVGNDASAQTMNFDYFAMERDNAPTGLHPGTCDTGQTWTRLNSYSLTSQSTVSMANGLMKFDALPLTYQTTTEAMMGFYAMGSDVDVEMTGVMSETIGVASLFFRMDDTGQNGYLCQLEGAVGRFYRRINGVYTALGTTWTVPTKLPFRLRLVTNGTTFYAQLNGVHVRQVTDTTFNRPGYFGIRGYNEPSLAGAGVQVDSFHASALGDPHTQQFDLAPTGSYTAIVPRRSTLPVKWQNWPARPTLNTPDGAAYDAEILADGPIGYWKFGETLTTETLTVVQDNFNKTASTSVVGPPQHGAGPPVALAGTWGIINNTLYPVTSTVESSIAWDISLAAIAQSYTLQYTIQTVSPGDPGPIVRVVDFNNWVLVQTAFNGASAIHTRLNGSYTQISEAVSIPWAAGDVVKVTVTPTTITAFRNGVQVMQTVSSVLNHGTRVGVRASSITALRIDDLLVTAEVPVGHQRALDSSTKSNPTQFFDDFNRPDDATALGTSSSGHTWTALSGVWGIQGNRAYLVSNIADGQNLAVLNTGFSDGVITVQVPANGAGTFLGQGAVPSLCFRVQDVSNHWVLEAGGGGNFALFTRTAGTYTQVANVTGQLLSPGDTITLAFFGPYIQVRKNGVPLLNHYSTAFQTAVQHGLRAFQQVSGSSGSPNGRWDNFSFLPTGTRHGVYSGPLEIALPGPTPTSYAFRNAPFRNGSPRQGQWTCVEIPNHLMWSPQITGDMTIEAWINLETYPHLNDQRQGIFGKGNNLPSGSGAATQYEYMLSVYTDGRLNMTLWNLVGSDTVSVTSDFGVVVPGRWHHVATVYKRGQYLALFVDGVRVATSQGVFTLANVLAAGNRGPVIGSRGNEPIYFPGLISNVAFYDKALSDERLAAHAGAGPTGGVSTPTTGVIASYELLGRATDASAMNSVNAMSQIGYAPANYYTPPMISHESTVITSIDFQVQLTPTTQTRVGIAAAFTTTADIANIPWLTLDNGQPAYVDLPAATLTPTTSTTTDTWNTATLGAPLTLPAGVTYSIAVVSTTKTGNTYPRGSSTGTRKNIVHPTGFYYHGANAAVMQSSVSSSLALLFRLNGTRTDIVRPALPVDRDAARKTGVSTGTDTHLSDMRWAEYGSQDQDVTFQVRYAGVDGHAMALVFRGLNDNNFAWLELNNSTGIIRTMLAGVITNLGGTASLAPVPDTWTTYRVVIQGGDVLVYRNGVLEYTETAPTLPTGTSVGIGTASVKDRFKEISGPRTYRSVVPTQLYRTINAQARVPVTDNIVVRQQSVMQTIWSRLMGFAYNRSFTMIPRRERYTNDPVFLDNKTTYPRRP